MRYQQVKEDLTINPHKWLITGVVGFIGSTLLEELLLSGQKVIGLDNFSTGKKANLDEVEQNVGKEIWDKFTFIEGDIRPLDECKKPLKGLDYVLHQAALGSVPRSIENPIATNESNLTGFLNMLVAARDEGVRKFAYAASSSTYGDNEALPKIEDQIGKPLSPYSVTKYANELYADVFYRTFGLRYFNVFGKRQDPNGAYAAVIPKWTKAMISGGSVYINGDGETSPDFCYIENVVQTNILSALADGDSVNHVYNVVVGDRTTLNDLFHIIKEGLLLRFPQLQNLVLKYRPFRRGDVRHSQADISKAKGLLGYEPQYKIAEGIEQSLDWYVENLS